MWNLKKPNLYKQKAKWWLPGVESWENWGDDKVQRKNKSSSTGRKTAGL